MTARHTSFATPVSAAKEGESSSVSEAVMGTACFHMDAMGAEMERR
jgi:hypothetical protein